MLQAASGFGPDLTLGRFIIQTNYQNRAWEVVVEPDAAAKLLVVVTAFTVE